MKRATWGLVLVVMAAACSTTVERTASDDSGNGDRLPLQCGAAPTVSAQFDAAEDAVGADTPGLAIARFQGDAGRAILSGLTRAVSAETDGGETVAFIDSEGNVSAVVHVVELADGWVVEGYEACG